MMMTHGGRGMYDYNRHFPGGRGRGKGDAGRGERLPSSGRPYSIDEDIDRLNEEDEDIEREREKVSHSVYTSLYSWIHRQCPD